MDYWAALFWLGLMVACLLVEAATVSLVSVWFACGALAALLISAFAGPVWLQLVAFLAVSVGMLALLRPMVRKYIKPKLVRTNVDSVVGAQGYVLEDIHNDCAQGRVKLGGMTWSARSTSGDAIPARTLVKVDRVEGVKVFVSPAGEPAKKN